MKKLFFIKYFLLPAVLFLFTTCSDPVFYIVSREVKPIEPLIKGSPTNFTLFNGAVYVASGKKLYQYGSRGNETKWYKPSDPGDRILQIASTVYYLYALCYNDDNPSKKTIRRMNASGTWADVSVDTGNYTDIQNIYSAADTVFISAAAATSYFIFYINDLEESGELAAGELSGAAFDGTDYYICTKGSGIYKIDRKTMNKEKYETDVQFMGIINLENSINTVAAISRGGELYIVGKTSNTVSSSGASFGGNWSSTGALAVWRDETNTPRLLLAGRQDQLVYTTDSGYTYGYMELQFDDTGIVGGFYEPGNGAPSSVSDNDRFKSTIGKYPVNYIFQTPMSIDAGMRLFASTQKDGVWSYRLRDGEWQWNAED